MAIGDFNYLLRLFAYQLSDIFIFELLAEIYTCRRDNSSGMSL